MQASQFLNHEDTADIEQTVLRYMDAAKSMDWEQLRILCTNKMYRQFHWITWLAFWITRTICSRRWNALSLQNLKVESVDDSQAVVSYSLDWGRQHFYERVALLRQDGLWKVDGKFM